MNIITSSKLKQAAEIAATIEKHQSEMAALNQKIQSLLGEAFCVGNIPLVAIDTSSKATRIKRISPRTTSINSVCAQKSKLAGIPRPVSPSGPLAPAVVRILQRYGRPMQVKEILIALEHDRYVWTAKDPKQTLYVRIGKLQGVKKTPDGFYAAEPTDALSRAEHGPTENTQSQ